jgi:iron(III) transport system ATP-binding protein
MDSAGASAVLDVRYLVKRFQRRGGDIVNAVDHISLTVARGEFVVLLGPSGCGKTTLLRCVAGLERPDEGEISINGRCQYSSKRKITVPAEQRHLSMVFQSYALWPHMTVYDNVAFPLVNQRVPKVEIKRRVAASLAKVGVGELTAQHPGQLSGGQQQRVALARALVANDGLILFDEPLSNVDARVREELRFELLSMQQELGFSALYVTHDQGEAMAMADRIAVLGGGRIVQLGNPESIYAEPASRYVAGFVGSINEIPGEVLEVDSGIGLTVETSLGKVLGIAGVEGIQVGQAVALTWRPERGHLAEGSGSPRSNRWAGRVEASMFLGSHTENVIRIGDVTQRVWTTGSALKPAGKDVWVGVDRQWIRALPVD